MGNGVGNFSNSERVGPFFFRRRRRKKHAIRMRKMEQQAAALVAGAVVQPNKIEDKKYVADECIYLFMIFIYLG